MKNILRRLATVPLVFIMIIMAFVSLGVVSLPYWIITGKDFVWDKLLPFYIDVLYYLHILKPRNKPFSP